MVISRPSFFKKISNFFLTGCLVNVVFTQSCSVAFSIHSSHGVDSFLPEALPHIYNMFKALVIGNLVIAVDKVSHTFTWQGFQYCLTSIFKVFTHLSERNFILRKILQSVVTVNKSQLWTYPTTQNTQLVATYCVIFRHIALPQYFARNFAWTGVLATVSFISIFFLQTKIHAECWAGQKVN